MAEKPKLRTIACYQEVSSMVGHRPTLPRHRIGIDGHGPQHGEELQLTTLTTVTRFQEARSMARHSPSMPMHWPDTSQHGPSRSEEPKLTTVEAWLGTPPACRALHGRASMDTAPARLRSRDWRQLRVFKRPEAWPGTAPACSGTAWASMDTAASWLRN